MSCKRLSAFILVATVLVAGCSSKRVFVAPVFDVSPYGRIGLVTFTAENARGELNIVATEYFAEDVLEAQQIELLELGDLDQVLAEVGRDRLDIDAVKAIGEAFGVPAVFLGDLKVSSVQPSADITALRVEASITVQAAVRLASTESGGTIWRESSRITDTVGHLSWTGGIPDFSAEDPRKAYGPLVEALSWELTRDFRPTYR
jgi:hypothetical protein